MEVLFEQIKTKSPLSDTILEDCISYDLGLSLDFDSKLAENKFRTNFESLVGIYRTNDGYQIDDLNTKDSSGRDYCIVYVAFKQVISELEVIDTTTEVEKWDAINRAVAHYFKLTLID